MVYIAREIDGCIAAMTIDSGVSGGCRRSSPVPEIASLCTGEFTILISLSSELHNAKRAPLSRTGAVAADLLVVGGGPAEQGADDAKEARRC